MADPVATVEIPLSQSDVDWLIAARNVIAPGMLDADVLGWMATQGRHLLAQEITAMLVRHEMAESQAAQDAIRDAAIPAPPADFGDTP